MLFPKRTYFKNYIFTIDEHVYEPSEDTFLIAEKMTVSKDDVVLDMGTGCGILAVLAAKKTKKVVAIDINPQAIKYAKKNAEINGVRTQIDHRIGDLFQSIKKTEFFSLILFNSPYLPSEPYEEKSLIGKAWAGGPNGRQVIDRFIADAPKFLVAGGRILLVQSSLSNISRTLEKFNEMNLMASVIAQVKVPFEIIALIEARLN